jgi:hypothetical protein
MVNFLGSFVWIELQDFGFGFLTLLMIDLKSFGDLNYIVDGLLDLTALIVSKGYNNLAPILLVFS